MGRIHLFEIEDQNWCPRLIRETITDFLLGLYSLLKIYEPAFQKICSLLTKLHIECVIDCCSGSGGPVKQLRKYLDDADKHSVTIILTDKFPNISLFQKLELAYGSRVVGKKNSIDAANLPSSLKGLRTFFSSFHHFSPSQAIKILQNAVNNNAPIAIFESTQRHPVDFIRALFSPLLTLFFVPFAKRLTWRKLFWTYIIPITPFMVMWDYIVSNLRTYSTQELHALVNQLDAPDYIWEIGKLWSKKAKCQIPYLIGYKEHVVYSKQSDFPDDNKI
jgi:hypothetical protein